MVLQTAPGYIGQGAFATPVELDRNWVAAVSGRRQGILRYGDFALTPSASAMQMTIGKGDAILQGGESSTTQGYYYAWSNASEVLNWPAAAASPRIDTLLMRVIDLQYGTDASPNGALWQIHSGTPSGSPVALADSQFAVGGALHRYGAWMRIADVLVPASVVNLSTATITPVNRFARIGGRTLVKSATDLPTDGTRGEIAVTLDDASTFVYDGTIWRSIDGGGTWQSLTPYLTAGYTANSFGYAPQYKVLGNTVKLRGNILKTSGTIATGTVIATLPANLRPVNTLYLVAGTSTSTNADITTRLDIGSTGAIIPGFTQGKTGTTAPTWVSLDGIEYDIV